MRPRNQQARDQLPTLLRRRPGAKAGELAALAGVSQPTVSRMLKEAAGQVVALGRGPRRRYYGRRALRGLAGSFPVYAVDTAGRATQVATLDLVEPDGTVLDVAALGWPVEEKFRDGHWPGLPYPLQDMRPQGFLGAVLRGMWRRTSAFRTTRATGRMMTCWSSSRNAARTPRAT